MRLVDPVIPDGNKLSDQRLVGYAPRLQITDGGMTPDPGRHRPSVMRSRIALTASNRDDASVSSVSFHVDRDLLRQLQPGDDLRMSRTRCAGLALSIVRSGELIAAAGAVTAVDLGNSFAARSPHQLIQEAAQIFQGEDPEFSFSEYPIEFAYKKKRRILFHGHCRLGEYEVWLWHGFLRGIPGVNESAAICKAKRQVPAYATCSAQLLENDHFELVRWSGD